ncbi:cupin domain-containing protein [Pseudoroseicyclus aestuarii]|uniref:Uncharacterized protein YjlB n=1 Tax=Pseudoroseicyclus aestuarii TaxID=1795041 RepID=A0A318T045_9RHOB|nr:cupin domain-containing protein [Pseudoroseicyclus aestuarii]PYE85427.1 uncharacterized protein YjlB [Pseudoroseicyclus aestuarii]
MPIEEIRIPANGGIPNHPDWPALVVPGALEGDAEEIRQRLEANGWGGTWVWTVFTYHHFHPDAHEALVCASGTAEVQIGGAAGDRVAIRPGDGLILPAGTGHRCLSQSRDFAVVGAYPPGQTQFSTCHAGDAVDLAALRAVPRHDRDPFTGQAFGSWSSTGR